jgi:hypothetical protein
MSLTTAFAWVPRYLSLGTLLTSLPMICSPLCPSLQLESWADRGVANPLHEPESYPMFAGTAKPLLPTSLARQVHLNLPIHSLGGPLVPPEVVFSPYIPVMVALPCPHCLFPGGGGVA